jgi:predicted DCC family thiol-disulfide oxidoreductase YuxK
VHRETILIPDGKLLLLYDGDCGLCNRAVQWLLRRDKNDTFLFCPLQSPKAQSLLENAPLKIRNSDSIVLYANGDFYNLSGAILRAGAALGGVYRLFWIAFLFPPFLRDGVYRFIARNRKRWWPFDASCMLPDATSRHKFID